MRLCVKAPGATSPPLLFRVLLTRGIGSKILLKRQGKLELNSQPPKLRIDFIVFMYFVMQALSRNYSIYIEVIKLLIFESDSSGFSRSKWV